MHFEKSMITAMLGLAAVSATLCTAAPAQADSASAPGRSVSGLADARSSDPITEVFGDIDAEKIAGTARLIAQVADQVANAFGGNRGLEDYSRQPQQGLRPDRAGYSDDSGYTNGDNSIGNGKDYPRGQYQDEGRGGRQSR
ncbi:hypothetical protein [Nocardia wallacei]|uniref:hypothetical protein n=1 Tax=Nocardia wallacei TaxID=480035 RepID=UPI0024557D83|nr:hypothetical protein [Nocardia wallacei]